MHLKSGQAVVPMEEEDLAEQKRIFPAISRGLVRLQPGGCVVPDWNPALLDDVFDFKFRPSDVVIMTYPKCGTTWTQEIVWTMRHNPNFDHPEADAHLFAKTPYIEADVIVTGDHTTPMAEQPIIEILKRLSPDADPKSRVFLQLSEVSPNPRTFKTHLPFSVMPKNLLDTCKVIYVARNPFDVCISFCHHTRILKGLNFSGTLDDFVDSYIKGDLLYGSYMEHFKEAWTKRGHKNLHFLFYEDSKKDPLGEIRKLDSFLGTGLSDATLSKITDYTSFSAMKGRAIFANQTVEGFNLDIAEKEGGFFRKGEAGDWKQMLTKEQEEKIRSWMESALEGTGFKFQEGTEK